MIYICYFEIEVEPPDPSRFVYAILTTIKFTLKIKSCSRVTPLYILVLEIVMAPLYIQNCSV